MTGKNRVLLQQTLAEEVEICGGLKRASTVRRWWRWTTSPVTIGGKSVIVTAAKTRMLLQRAAVALAERQVRIAIGDLRW